MGTFSTEDKLREYLRKVTVELADTRRRISEPIAVIGASARFPGAEGVDAYWELLRSGRDAIGEVPPSRFDIAEYVREYGVYTTRGGFLGDISGWDPELFGHSPQEALRMDPQQRMLMELVWEAFENAGTPAATLAGSRTGVTVGFSDTLQYARLQSAAQGWQAYTDVYFGQGSSPSVVAGRLAYHYDLHGPTMAVDTACSSSLVAVHLAAESLRRGECDLAVAGGGFLMLHPDAYIYGCATSMFSREGVCKTFDSGADGYVIGEGGGIVLLARLSDALRDGRRIRAVIRGSAINQDGRSNGLTAPNRAAQVDVIRQAQSAARADPDDILYVEAHGSGTKLGDAIELGALHDVFGGRSPDRPLRIGAVKTNIGHTQAAAGIAGLIKAVLVLENDLVPPNLNTVRPADAIPDDGTITPVTTTAGLAEDDRVRLVGVSSFGWSGTNAHMILEAAPSQAAAGAPGQDASAVPAGAGTVVPGRRGHEESNRPPGPLHLLPVSAASDAALRSQLGRHSEAVGGRDLADVAFTLQRGRSELEFRRAVVARNRAEAVQRLAEAAAGGGVRRVKGAPKVAYLLPGVGDMYSGMGRDLYRSEPVFAAAIDECLRVARDRCDIDLRSVFFDIPEAPAGDFAAMLGRGPATAEPLSHAELAHPFLFAVEYALAQLLAHRGATPDLLIGYSLGEYVAACLAGVFSLEDAMWIVVERARMIAAAPTGHMLAAGCPVERVRPLLPAEVEIAAISSPQMTVLSGTPTGIERVSAILAERGIAARRLRSAHPFHSSLLEPAREKLAALIATVNRQEPSTTIVSNVTGEVLDRATDPDYWGEHLCRPVRFADGAVNCVAQGVDVFVELGAGQTLGGLVRQNAAGAFTVLGTLPGIWPAERASEQLSVAETVARLWEAGVRLEWTATGQLVDLPSYPFQRTRFWPAPGSAQRPVTDPTDLCYAPTWQQDLTRPPTLPLAGTVLIFGVAGLARLVRNAGGRAVEVVAGTTFSCTGDRFTVDPADAAHYREIVKAVQPATVVDGWGRFDPLLLTIQAFSELSVDHPVRLFTVTDGAVEIVGGDLLHPDRAAVHGLGRVAKAEYANLTWRGVDAGRPEEMLAELRRADGEMVGWRNGRRWRKGWTPLELEATGTPWRSEGAYLITGGTRGLGLALARHLTAHGVTKLALVSRNATGYDLPDLKHALLLDADTSSPEQLRAAFQTCRDHFGALDGVIHAAGVPAGGMIANRTPAETAKVIAPKVAAMGPIGELVGGENPPELVVLYSSAVTVFGGLGEGDYCAANSVLDAYASALNGGKTRVVTIAWGPWQHDDWQSTSLDGELASRVHAYRQTYGFTEAGGCALLDRIAATTVGSVVAVRQQLEQALRDWSGITDLSSLVTSTTTAERFSRPQLRVPYLAPRSDVEAMIAEVWGAYLGIDQVGVHDPFFDLGGNSLVGMAMVSAIEKRLDRRIAPAVLFEHPTVAAFAAALCSTATSDSDVLAGSSARGERRRRARK